MAAQETVKQLQQLLADVYGLYLKTQNYHWHVKGPHFLPLHKLFEGQYKQLAEMVDSVAECIVILGSQAPASFKLLDALCNISDGDSNQSAQNMLSDLASDQNKLITDIINVMTAADNEGQVGTESQMSEYIAMFEKNKWFLENHL